MPTTADGLVYPASSANTQLWTHFQNLADSMQTLWTDLKDERHADLTRATTQSITTATITYLSWTVETVDTHGFIAVPGSAITIPAGHGGVYSISAFARFAANVTGLRNLFIEIDGVQVAEHRLEANSISAQQTSMPVSLAAKRLAAGAVIKVGVYQNSGGSLNIESSMPPLLQIIRHAA
jgi:hypothetical protein